MIELKCAAATNTMLLRAICFLDIQIQMIDLNCAAATNTMLLRAG